MQGKFLFEYAVIRVVPRVEREEFMNVGVILYCRDLNFLEARIRADEAKLQAFHPEIDLDELKQHLDAFCAISRGKADGGPIAQLNPAERFRWLTALRSTMVQTSRVHPGYCDQPDTMLEKLMHEQVG